MGSKDLKFYPQAGETILFQDKSGIKESPNYADFSWHKGVLILTNKRLVNFVEEGVFNKNWKLSNEIPLSKIRHLSFDKPFLQFHRISIDYENPNGTDGFSIIFEVDNVDEWSEKIDVAMKEREEIPVQNGSQTPQMQQAPIYINVGKIGDDSKEVNVKDSVVQRSDIGGDAPKAFKNCPYCGESIDLPKTPKFCPYCSEQLSN